jgi:hypothetical protein
MPAVAMLPVNIIPVVMPPDCYAISSHEPDILAPICIHVPDCYAQNFDTYPSYASIF